MILSLLCWRPNCCDRGAGATETSSHTKHDAANWLGFGLNPISWILSKYKSETSSNQLTVIPWRGINALNYWPKRLLSASGVTYEINEKNIKFLLGEKRSRTWSRVLIRCLTFYYDDVTKMHVRVLTRGTFMFFWNMKKKKRKTRCFTEEERAMWLSVLNMQVMKRENFICNSSACFFFFPSQNNCRKLLSRLGRRCRPLLCVFKPQTAIRFNVGVAFVRKALCDTTWRLM